MIQRLITIVAAVVLAIGRLLAAAVPASANNGSGDSGATGGTTANCPKDTCIVGAWIRYSGPGYDPAAPSGGAGQVTVNVAPPPCLWINIGNQHSGSRRVISWSTGVQPGDPYDTYESYQQAKQLVKDGASAPAGWWYELPENPDAPAAIAAECLKLPLYEFVPDGGVPPLPPLQPVTLAQFAVNHLTLPSPVVTASPAAVGFVNLASYVRWNTLRTTIPIRASVPRQAATVVARAQSVTIRVSPAGSATPYSASCALSIGSKYPAGQQPANGPGVPPDCGVLWAQPSPGATITVSITWMVRWHQGTSDQYSAADPVVPGVPAGGITTTGTTAPLPVREIQAVNGT
jgi:hypothetical protein